MIPKELQQLQQWACSADIRTKQDKRPVDIFGRNVSVTNPTSWDTYESCFNSNFPNVGIILTTNDPYAVIDLDEPQTPEQQERHKKILAMADSYAERSVSGKGVHIFVRGSIPHGVRRDKVEVYSSERYIICTGDALNGKGIEDRQELLDALYREMDSTSGKDLVEEESTLTDKDVLTIASNADNGEKFMLLWEGRWQEAYPSQSEADLALLSILAFYTRSNEQVRRMFRESGLGQRAKAQRDSYLDGTLKKVRAAQPELVDVSSLVPVPVEPEDAAVDATGGFLAGAPPKLEQAPIERPGGGYRLPGGLVGELAHYITDSAVRPVLEVGLTGALALCAGLWGRGFNVSGTGLNLYLILLAGTGTGKGGALTGVENVLAATRQKLPSIDAAIGPAGFASGQALLRALDAQPSFVSFVGEFGHLLQQMCDERAPASLVMLKRVLLDLYSRSGAKNTIRSNVYADSAKNTKNIVSPNVTLFGESTPGTFYENITTQHVAEGLVPRFSIVEYSGGRPRRNQNAFYPLPNMVAQQLVESVTCAYKHEQTFDICEVPVETSAGALLSDFDLYADSKINEMAGEVHMQMWNRAHLKALKLAALVAIGHNHNNPIIDKEAADWAIEFVHREVVAATRSFKSQGNTRQEEELLRIMREYEQLTPAQRRTYKVPMKLINYPTVVPYTYLRRMLCRLKPFVQDRRGEHKALQDLLRELVLLGIVKQVDRAQAKETYGVTAPLYVLGDA